jgi:FAD dependent oxidoreductase/S-layer homology domain
LNIREPLPASKPYISTIQGTSIRDAVIWSLLFAFFGFQQITIAAPASQSSRSTLPLQPSIAHTDASKKPPIKPGADSVVLLDTMAVTTDQPQNAIRTFDASKPKRVLTCDVLIVGGGVGGVAAAQKIWALTGKTDQSNILKHPKPLSVILVEETDWLGGQMTAQGVPALDENYLVAGSGSTLAFQDLRKAIRRYYKMNATLTTESIEDPLFNPGNCWVSYLSFEPSVALEQIDHLLKPARENGSLKVLYRSKPFKVNHGSHLGDEPRVASVDFADCVSGETFTVKPKICLDATELGDVVALAKLDYSTGSDSRSTTGEPHAPEVGNKENVQDFTYPFVLELRPGTDNRGEKPELFDEFNKRGKFSFFGYKMFDSVPKPDGEFMPFWEYRRLIDASNFDDPNYRNDLAVMNWESNDLRGLNIIDHPPSVQADHLARGKLLSLGFLYWLQNLAPRDDGGIGYPELTLRQDMLGTADGLSKYPYIRESRRVKAKKTIVEQNIVTAFNQGSRATPFNDSVGIGLYPVDIHGPQEVPGAGQATKPFQIPLGSLIPLSGGNLLPACKNIGTTHITNGAYRLHPIEWAIGEAQGTLAALALSSKTKPSVIFDETNRLRQLQKLLVETGVPIYWYDDVPTDDKDFAAIQLLSALEILPGNKENLHFAPEDKLSRAEFAQALAKLFFGGTKESKIAKAIADLPSDASAQALQECVNEGLLKLDANGMVNPSKPLTLHELDDVASTKFVNSTTKQELSSQLKSQPDLGQTGSELTRRQVAKWLYILATSKQYFGRL